MDIQQARVIVTGGTSGIGLETARQLVRAGARVAICGRDEARLQQAADQTGAIAIRADVRHEDQVRHLVETAADRLGGYNVLVNNAAYGYFAPLTELDTARFNDQLATNITGAMLAGRESARHFMAQNYGNILNIASTAGTAGFAGGTAYVATKFALRGMTECWRHELRRHNIRVMLLNPSEVQTDFAANAGREARPHNPTKLEALDIAHTVVSMLQLHDRGFITEATVWATNPQ